MGFFGDGIVGNDFNIFEILQFLEIAIADHQSGDMHSFAIAIIALEHFPFNVVVLLGGKYQPLSPIALGNQCFFSKGTHVKSADLSNHVGRFCKVL